MHKPLLQSMSAHRIHGDIARISINELWPEFANSALLVEAGRQTNESLLIRAAMCTEPWVQGACGGSWGAVRGGHGAEGRWGNVCALECGGMWRKVWWQAHFGGTRRRRQQPAALVGVFRKIPIVFR